jgi:uncharacterized protein YhbP (UPF0306 family)
MVISKEGTNLASKVYNLKFPRRKMSENEVSNFIQKALTAYNSELDIFRQMHPKKDFPLHLKADFCGKLITAVDALLSVYK